MDAVRLGRCLGLLGKRVRHVYALALPAVDPPFCLEEEHGGADDRVADLVVLAQVSEGGQLVARLQLAGVDLLSKRPNGTESPASHSSLSMPVQKNTGNIDTVGPGLADVTQRLLEVGRPRVVVVSAAAKFGHDQRTAR